MTMIVYRIPESAQGWKCSHPLTVDSDDGRWRSCLTCGIGYERGKVRALLKEQCLKRWRIDFKAVHRILTEPDEDD